MITNFNGKVAKDVWEQNQSKSLRADMWVRAKALLTIMHSTSSIEDPRIKGQPPAIRLHKLGGDRKGFWSVTIKLLWCITFKIKDGEFSEVKIENYH
jgi:proteic killer suppression protein